MQIYIIDDDHLSLFLAKTKLSLIDPTLDLRTFPSGADALQEIKTNGVPHLILLDLNMPVMDGWRFLEELSAINQEEVTSCQVYILSSSISQTEYSKGTQNPLVAGFLHKPIKTEDVKNLLLP